MRIVFRLFALLFAGAGLYLAAALLGSAVPANTDWSEATTGTVVYVVDNGIHTDLVLPAASFGDLVHPADFANPAAARRPYLAFGWGNRDFYINTPTWSDVSPLRVAGAMVGVGPTVVHVTALAWLSPGPRVRPLVLDAAQYARLEAHVRATFVPGASIRGYGGDDAFYPAHGGYSGFNTCNQWTGRGLRAAGVRMGVWTPFPWGVMAWL